jgi:SulP family sulfate permease
MVKGIYKFDRLEFSGSLGDLGTLIPLSLALLIVNRLNITSVFLMVGISYITSGLFFRLPIPIQPLKVVAAIAIASPKLITIPIIMAAGILIGIILLLLAFTGLIDWLARLFSKPVVRGIQLGLGFILIAKGIGFISKPELFINQTDIINFGVGLPINLLLGIISILIVLFLISNKRFPAALVIMTLGVIVGVIFGALKNVNLILGAVPVEIISLNTSDFINAFLLLVIPQIPLTLGNAIIGTKDACTSLFDEKNNLTRVTHKNLSISMGVINLISGIIGGMPLCHGAGGLAAHYRFGARTGGSNIMIGLVFVTISLVFGKMGLSLLSTIPAATMGTLLLFAGLELSLLILDIKEKEDLFIVLIVAGIGYSTTNIGIAFMAGILIAYLIKWKKIQI